jgi:hypothetical protein
MATPTFKQFMESDGPIWSKRFHKKTGKLAQVGLGPRQLERLDKDIKVDVLTKDHKPLGVVYHGTRKPLDRKVILWSKSDDMVELADNLIGLEGEGIDIHTIEEPHTKRGGISYTLHIMDIINISTKKGEGVDEDNSNPLYKQLNVGAYPGGTNKFNPTAIKLPKF